MAAPSSIFPDDGELMALLNPVWFNTYWVKNALELYEGVTQHADKLDEHAHFIGLVQKFSLDAVVLGLCKLFDRSNPQYVKDTVPSLLDYLKANLTDVYVSRLETSILTDLEMSHEVAARIVGGFRTRTDFAATKAFLFDSIDALVPTRKRCAALEKLITRRDKIVVHQERVSDDVKEELKYLPSIMEIQTLNKWASNFCRFMACIMSNATLITNGPSARIAALNVIAKVLGKNFDLSSGGAAYQECEEFYKST
jgi:hypothetical protein